MTLYIDTRIGTADLLFYTSQESYYFSATEQGLCGPFNLFITLEFILL